MAEKGIPSWPKVTIRLYDDHNAEVKIAGNTHQVNHFDPRQAAILLIAERAGQLGRPVRVTAIDADGQSWPLIVHPSGEVDAVDEKTAAAPGKPRWMWFAAAALAVVLIAGTSLYLFVFKGGSEETTKNTPVSKLPALPEPNVGPDQFSARPVPPGWTTNMRLDGRHRRGVSPSRVTRRQPGRDHYPGRQDRRVRQQRQGAVAGQGAEGDRQPGVHDGRPQAGRCRCDAGFAQVLGGRFGVEAVTIPLPSGASVQFFGTSPLVVGSGDDGGANVVSDGKLQPVQNQPRLATMLLAEGDKALMARYSGPLFWSQPGKPLVLLNPKAPAGGTRISQVVATSPRYAAVLWSTGKSDTVVPAIHSTANGTVVATCPQVKGSEASSWKWVPDQAGKVAAFGECLINLSLRTTSQVEQFDPLSITQRTIFGQAGDGLVAVQPGRKPTPLPKGTARPWGLVEPARDRRSRVGALCVGCPVRLRRWRVVAGLLVGSVLTASAGLGSALAAGPERGGLVVGAAAGEMRGAACGRGAWGRR